MSGGWQSPPVAARQSGVRPNSHRASSTTPSSISGKDSGRPLSAQVRTFVGKCLKDLCMAYHVYFGILTWHAEREATWAIYTQLCSMTARCRSKEACAGPTVYKQMQTIGAVRCAPQDLLPQSQRVHIFKNIECPNVCVFMLVHVVRKHTTQYMAERSG